MSSPTRQLHLLVRVRAGAGSGPGQVDAPAAAHKGQSWKQANPSHSPSHCMSVLGFVARFIQVLEGHPNKVRAFSEHKSCIWVRPHPGQTSSVYRIWWHTPEMWGPNFQGFWRLIYTRPRHPHCVHRLCLLYPSLYQYSSKTRM